MTSKHSRLVAIAFLPPQRYCDAHLTLLDLRMGMLSEFREFAIKGSMIEMAVGIIIGAGFTKIVDSLVKDIVMPPIGLLLGGTDFRQLYFSLNGVPYATLAEAEKAGAPVLRYGAFVTTVVEFTIVVFAIFLALKLVNRLRRTAP